MEKNEIINNYSKNVFQQFLIDDTEGRILQLLDEEGMRILNNSKLKEDRINYILTYSSFKNELLQNKEFLKMVLDTNCLYYSYFNQLDNNTYNKILENCIDLNISPTKIARMFCKFNIEYKKNILSNWQYNKELLNNIFVLEDNPSVINVILDNHIIDLNGIDIDLNSYFYNTKMIVLKTRLNRNVYGKNDKDINMPSSMINNELMGKIWNNYSIFTIRNIINNAQYFLDTTNLNNYIKSKEDNAINEYKSGDIISPYFEIYNSFKKYKELENNQDDVELYDEYRLKYIRLMSKKENEYLYDEINKRYKEGNISEVLDYFYMLSDRIISNYIIDYHFEENYHNIMIDLYELMRFYYDGNIVLSEDKVDLYNRILNIDTLTIEEKQELHNYLKNINVIEMFYDDMSMARKIVHEAIKDYSLSTENLMKYKDSDLSNKYGVDVYNIDNKPFFGIVKTGIHASDSLPAGHSYSLVGKGGLAVYGNVSEANTFLYDADNLNPDQIIHVFPFDSFTYYHPFEYSVESTNRVNVLMMPEDLVRSTPLYNELLILEQGKEKADFDEKIPELKRIALYCVDAINSKNVEKAKDMGIGIVLVKSDKYLQDTEYYQKKIGHIDNPYEYNYLNDTFDLNKFESKR